jgi:outer membrane murein-binding lipoprotein Lpp
MVFEFRDIITIVVGTGSLVGTYYALKRSVDRLSTSVKNMDTFHKREITLINDSLRDTKSDFYNRLNDMKDEHSKSIEKIDAKIDNITTQTATISANLAELTGYIKAKK